MTQDEWRNYPRLRRSFGLVPPAVPAADRGEAPQTGATQENAPESHLLGEGKPNPSDFDI